MGGTKRRLRPASPQRATKSACSSNSLACGHSALKKTDEASQPTIFGQALARLIFQRDLGIFRGGMRPECAGGHFKSTAPTERHDQQHSKVYADIGIFNDILHRGDIRAARYGTELRMGMPFT